MVAQRYGTDHHELLVEPDAVAVVPQLVWHYGEPFADPSAVPTWYVAEMARRHVTVALTGDGGDECFLGYGRYKAMRWLARLDRCRRQAAPGSRNCSPPPRPQCGGVSSCARSPMRSKRRERPRRGAICRRLAFFGDGDKGEGYGEAMRNFCDRSVADLLAPYFRRRPEAWSPVPTVPTSTPTCPTI